MQPALAKCAVSEALATAFLVATVVGSGIMAERLAGGNVAITLAANTLAAGVALIALILAFGLWRSLPVCAGIGTRRLAAERPERAELGIRTRDSRRN